MEWIGALIFVVLLFIFPKQMGILIAITVSGFATLIAYEKLQDNNEQKQRDAVSVAIVYATKDCPEKFPLHAVITNKSSKPVAEVRWNIASYNPGYSSNLVDYEKEFRSEYGTPYATDKILQPSQSTGICFAIPALKKNIDPSALIWLPIHKDVSFYQPPQ